MLIPHPAQVVFGQIALDGVIAVAIDRVSAREIVEFTDLGPHAAFADVPEQRTHITIIRRLDRAEFDAPRPGDHAELVMTVAAGAHDASRTSLRAQCTLREVRHDLYESVRDRAGARQTLSLIALSQDGAADPIALEPI